MSKNMKCLTDICVANIIRPSKLKSGKRIIKLMGIRICCKKKINLDFITF